MKSLVHSLLVVAVLVISVSEVPAARRSSLAGNILIKDADEIFFLPHRVGEYGRYVTFDFGSSDSLGTAGMIFDNHAVDVGLFMHRSDLNFNLRETFLGSADIDRIGDGGQNDFFGVLDVLGPFNNALNWWDVILGWKAGDTPIGLRLSVGKNFEDPPLPSEDANVTSLGFTLSTEAADVALAAQVGFARAETNTLAGNSESTPVSFGLGLRKTTDEVSQDVQLGYFASFDLLNYEITQPMLRSEETNFAFTGGVGPVYHPSQRVIIAAHVNAAFIHIKNEDTDGTGRVKDIVDLWHLPGCNVAGEFEIASWLQARVGARGVFVHVRSERTADTPPVLEIKETVFEYTWHTGLGFQAGDFALDVYLHPDNIFSGTDVLGNSSTAFGLVSASLAF